METATLLAIVGIAVTVLCSSDARTWVIGLGRRVRTPLRRSAEPTASRYGVVLDLPMPARCTPRRTRPTRAKPRAPRVRDGVLGRLGRMSPGDLRHLAIGPHADTVASVVAAAATARAHQAPVTEAAERALGEMERYLSHPAVEEALRQRDVAAEAVRRALPSGI